PALGARHSVPGTRDSYGLYDPQPGVSRHLRQDVGASARPPPANIQEWWRRLGLDWQDFRMDGGFEFFDHVGFLKAGINFSDALTTVSPTYADEIQRPEYGYGLDG